MDDHKSDNTEIEQERIRRIFALLKQHYPHARTGLHFDSPYQLFVAVLLSAQTTDGQVNRITAPLFAAVPTVQAMAGLEPAELEPYLRRCGLYRNKSRYLVAASRIIVERFSGVLPDNFEDLTSLPGIGRKSANVILNAAFGQPALAVDTHVFRVSRRLGLARSKSTAGVEEELKSRLPPREWGPAHHRLIAHGRTLCRARSPQCPCCFLKDLCLWEKAAPAGRSIHLDSASRDLTVPGKIPKS
ncbi:MAG: endonuclease III [Firmicutes bacterium]|nr:endonuclease III [Bacillota bacterium]